MGWIAKSLLFLLPLLQIALCRSVPEAGERSLASEWENKVGDVMAEIRSLDRKKKPGKKPAKPVKPMPVYSEESVEESGEGMSGESGEGMSVESGEGMSGESGEGMSGESGEGMSGESG